MIIRKAKKQLNVNQSAVNEISKRKQYHLIPYNE